MDYGKLKKGDKIRYQGKIGVLLTDPKYISTSSWGLWFADVGWEDGETATQFMLCRQGLEKVEEVKKNGR